jgi:hypothetical protein
MREYFAYVVLGTLLFLSFGAQISDRLRKMLSRKVGLNVVPSWRFFGPVPAIKDMHLLFRTQSQYGHHEHWREIPIPPQGRWRAVWNPSRFADKALSDLGNALSAGSHALRQRIPDTARVHQAVQLSQPYLALLSWVMDYAGQPEATELRQFALVGSGADQESQSSVIFVSRFHRAA